MREGTLRSRSRRCARALSWRNQLCPLVAATARGETVLARSSEVRRAAKALRSIRLARLEGEATSLRRALADVRLQLAVAVQQRGSQPFGGGVDGLSAAASQLVHAAEARARASDARSRLLSGQLECEEEEAGLRSAEVADLRGALIAERAAALAVVAAHAATTADLGHARRKAAAYKARLLRLFDLYLAAKERAADAVAAREFVRESLEGDLGRERALLASSAVTRA